MKKVIIVGGGVAGLICGKRLVDSGLFQVTLLEGSGKIGGRVETRKFGDHFIENGAQWVHGKDGNKIFELGSSHNLLTVGETTQIKFIEDTWFVTETGRVLERELANKYAQVIDEVVDGPDEEEVHGTVGDWARQRFERAALKHNLVHDRDLNKSVLDWAHRFQDNIDGSDNWFQTSLKGQHEYWECEGFPTIAWKSPASYSSLFGVILNGVPTEAPTFQPELPSWIELDKEVVKIERRSTEGDPVQVICSDQSQLTCDYLICTVSLGVLKFSYKELFTPQLPEKKIAAIDHLGIGCVDKFHFDFKARWWPEDALGFDLLWNVNDEVGDYWRSDIDEESLLKVVDGVPVWCRNILGFYKVMSHPTALNSWLTGPAAKLVEKMSDSQVQSTFMTVLRKFVKDIDIPEPEEFCRSTWYTNKFTRGSYSFRTMDSEKHNVCASDLAEPVLNSSGNPVLCFAGEATHSHYFSTVHGAYESGLREAERLIQLNSK